VAIMAAMIRTPPTRCGSRSSLRCTRCAGGSREWRSGARVAGCRIS